MTRPPGSGPFTGGGRRFAALAATTVVLLVVTAAPAAAATWTGTWDTTYGELQLTQQGASVTGSYFWAGGPGSITATASGQTLTGRFSDPSGSGPLEFTLSADGLNFSGPWSYDDGSGSGTWSGSRKTPLPPEDAPPPPAGAEVLAEPPAVEPPPDTKLAAAIRRFEDRFEADLKKNRKKQVRALRATAKQAGAALEQRRPSDADERKAENCAVAAVAAMKTAVQWLVRGFDALRKGRARKARAYFRRAERAKAKAERLFACAIRNLPVREEQEPPPAKAEGDSVEIIGFFPRLPQSGDTPADAIKPGGTMTACLDGKALASVFDYTAAAGSTISVKWTLPSGQTHLSISADAGPGSGRLVRGFRSESRLPDGTYTVEFTAGGRQLARATVTRDC